MSGTMHTSDHCLIPWDAYMTGKLPMQRPSLKMLLTLPLYLLDRNQHFTGLRGALWRLFGITRSSQNHNICTL